MFALQLNKNGTAKQILFCLFICLFVCLFVLCLFCIVTKNTGPSPNDNHVMKVSPQGHLLHLFPCISTAISMCANVLKPLHCLGFNLRNASNDVLD